MKKLKILNSVSFIVCAFSFTLILYSCAPKTFVRTMNPGWNSIEIRNGMTYDEAWEDTVDTLAKKFDLEVISKDSGYIRTGWNHKWTGELKDSYKVRAIAKFHRDEHMVELKSEAQHYSPGFIGIGEGWEMGTDERLIATLKSDLMGKIGRTSR